MQSNDWELYADGVMGSQRRRDLGKSNQPCEPHSSSHFAKWLAFSAFYAILEKSGKLARETKTPILDVAVHH